MDIFDSNCTTQKYFFRPEGSEMDNFRSSSTIHENGTISAIFLKLLQLRLIRLGIW